MKVIFSRKGFDSAYGGYSSPILPDGRLISLPIPSAGDDVRYTHLKLNDNRTYYDLMGELKPKIKQKQEGKLYSFDLTKDMECHLDPDVYKNVLVRDKNWRPTFGQIDASQTHLDNQKVKENDVFLFFGWFRKTNYKKGRLRFYGPDLHVMFGYLQIGDKIRLDNKFNVPKWMSGHPHTSPNRRSEPTNNTVYIAREKLTWDDDIPGSGVFNFNKALQLTKEGFSRSKWDLPSFFKNVKISRHTSDSWKKEGYFKSADIGQEFVVEDHENVEKWVKDLIDNNY